MNGQDKLEQIYIMIGAELKTASENEFKSDYIVGKLDAYVNVLSGMGFTIEAILKIYNEFGIDWSHILQR